MSRIVVQSKVGADGILRVEIPLGVFDVDRDVQVIVEQMQPVDADHEAYVKSLRALYGSWKGDFERMPQGDFEERESL